MKVRLFEPTGPIFSVCGNVVLALCLFVIAGSSSLSQSIPEYELPPIEYSATTASNDVSILERRLAAGELSLPRGSDEKSLRALLDLVSVPVDSQVLVFSKTSLQRNLIRPNRPRAMYFSDDCYIGWVPGGLFEAAVTDPHLGVVFYHLDSRQENKPLQFTRDRECLSCHGGSMTRDWPGLIVRSIYPDSEGNPITSAGSFLTGHESRIEDRWGGWYVTGEHGASRHMGNQIARGRGLQVSLDREAGANLQELSSFFPVAPYPRGDSDIVALMVLEHQVGLHNRLSTGALRVRKWTHYQRQLRKELGEPVTDEPEGSALRVVQSEAQRIIEYLFFNGEIRLPGGGIHGNDAFQAAFRENRREDGEGRSLKDFDLSTRLFKFRCSYMVYSKAFESLPRELKNEVYRRMSAGLNSETPPKEFSHLRSKERQAIREILLATHAGFAAASKRFAESETADPNVE